MLDFGAQARVAQAWSDMATGCMRTAMAVSAANMQTMAQLWGTSPVLPFMGLGNAPSQRNPLSTAMPWYRAPERNAVDSVWWLQPAAPPLGSAILNSMTLWQNSAMRPGWGLDIWQPPLPAAHGVSAAVPGLLALVAVGMAAQQALAVIEATQAWQSESARSVHTPPLPNYRSDGGHAVANVVLGSPMSAAALPLTGFALMMRMMHSMGAR